jgi:hypothetical protein
MPKMLVRAKRPAAKRAKPKRTASAAPSIEITDTADAGSGPITLTTKSGTWKIPGNALASLSMQWYYKVRHRSRWANSPEARQALTQTALEKLDQLGITKTTLSQISTDGIVEVGIPYEVENRGWAARILPWEFLLRAATANPALAVIRHLDCKGPRLKPTRTPARLLFVQSAPGPPLAEFSFDTESCLVQGSLRLKCDALENPTSDKLSATITALKPNVIHLAGFDIHQADDIYEIYNKQMRPERRIVIDGKSEWDGMFMATGSEGQVIRVDSEALGKALNPGDGSNAVLTCNFYHSAARVAPMAVACGCAAAVGFQDVVDDAVAERFFASFFQRWRALDWDLLTAFEQAWQCVGGADGTDTGVVLWSRESLLKKRLRSDKPHRKMDHNPLELGANRREKVRVHVEPNTEVNYSLLHNGEGLFRKFRFEKYTPDYAYGIDVTVELYVGADSFPYRATFDLAADDPVLDIASHVNLPLTSQFARSLREDVLTSLRVCVTYAGEELYHQTHRVKLLAVNQWAFDRVEGGRWLASFALPGDPAVARVVDSAQKYLMALRDDPSAGFDGYQSTDEKDPEHGDDGVDMQVRAIWAALSFDLPLNYINPPPVFTEGSQRLRTPSDVINGKRGTCIDLALLFAACLEYVEIYPVIFLLTDHAFPGYWRNERSYQDFLEMRKMPDEAIEGKVDASATAQRRLRFEEVRKWVRDGDLVPLETVWLTNHSGFAESVEAGVDNLRTSANFESLVNIVKLREEGVTPLPIAGEMK